MERESKSVLERGAEEWVRERGEDREKEKEKLRQTDREKQAEK